MTYDKFSRTTAQNTGRDSGLRGPSLLAGGPSWARANVGEEGTSVNVPSGATLRTFKPFAEGGEVNDPPWVTTWRNFSVESRANWKQFPVVLSLTCWISIGSVGSRLMS